MEYRVIPWTPGYPKLMPKKGEPVVHDKQGAKTWKNEQDFVPPKNLRNFGVKHVNEIQNKRLSVHNSEKLWTI